MPPIDPAWLDRAFALAERGRYSTSPNPMVGAVVVAGGRVVGEAFHRRAGEPHAEILALARAGRRARGADLYLTLEPCTHEGRTPPCAPGGGRVRRGGASSPRRPIRIPEGLRPRPRGAAPGRPRRRPGPGRLARAARPSRTSGSGSGSSRAGPSCSPSGPRASTGRPPRLRDRAAGSRGRPPAGAPWVSARNTTPCWSARGTVTRTTRGSPGGSAATARPSSGGSFSTGGCACPESAKVFRGPGRRLVVTAARLYAPQGRAALDARASRSGACRDGRRERPGRSSEAPLRARRPRRHRPDGRGRRRNALGLLRRGSRRPRVRLSRAADPRRPGGAGRRRRERASRLAKTPRLSDVRVGDRRRRLAASPAVSCAGESAEA